MAKELHAPNALGIFENGVIRDWPALESIFTMSDPPNVAHALYCGSLNEVMYLLQSGRVDLGFMAERKLIGLVISTLTGSRKMVNEPVCPEAAAPQTSRRWQSVVLSS